MDFSKPLFIKLLALLLYFFFQERRSIAQNCQSNQFGFSYNNDGFSTGSFFDTVPGGGFMFGHNFNYKKTVIKTDNAGNLLWSKKYDYSEASVYSEKGSGKVDLNGNIIIDLNSIGLALLDPLGNVINMKELVTNNGQDNVINDLIVLPDNKKLVFIRHGSVFSVGFLLVCLSEDISSIIWSKYVKMDTYFNKPSFYNNTLYIATKVNNFGYFIGINVTTGSVVKKSRFRISNSITNFYRIYETSTGYLVTGWYDGAPNWPNNHVVLRLDNNLNFINATGFNGISNTDALLLLPTEDGSYYGCSSITGSRFYVSPDNQVQWSKNTVSGWLTKPMNYLEYDDGLLSAGNGNWNNVGVGLETGLTIIKSDKNGYYPCFPFSGNQTTVGINSVVREDISIDMRDTSLVTLRNITPIVENITYRKINNCNQTQNCDQLIINGNNVVCGSGQFTYTGRRNTGCALPVNWQLTGGNFLKVIQNDSTIQITFLQSGTFTLIGKLGNVCPIADTIQIVVTLENTILNIGPPDTTLCVGNTIQLQAGGGFLNYLWQDGSNNSSYTVSSPGVYHVTVTTACGATLSDTINIFSAPIPELSIGPDRSKCNNDTIQLSATPGFLNYSWGNNYNINSLTGQSVIVNPLIDTFYYVKGEKTPGCFAYDTIFINVHHSPQIFLGNDTSICASTFLHLDAGPGFQQYSWSNGSTASHITVGSQGTYSVVATTSQGCSSYDTLKIISNFSLPQINLNKNNSLCKNEVRVLNPGQFVNYLWQDGSTNQTFMINSIGSYFVQVTDINGCFATDTVVISTINELPKDFLESNKEICNFGTNSLTPSIFYINYLWSTGASTQQIQVTQPGLYWLEVTDLNQCKGRDSTIVTLKECMKGLYVPSAFTPNNDGKNDQFGPLVFGPLKKFEFIIYNRWGQIVFRSYSPDKKWDGKLGGIQQDSNVYIWVCNYQLEGESVKSEKGTFTLIR